MGLPLADLPFCTYETTMMGGYVTRKIWDDAVIVGNLKIDIRTIAIKLEAEKKNDCNTSIFQPACTSPLPPPPPTQPPPVHCPPRPEPENKMECDCPNDVVCSPQCTRTSTNRPEGAPVVTKPVETPEKCHPMPKPDYLPDGCKEKEGGYKQYQKYQTHKETKAKSRALRAPSDSDSDCCCRHKCAGKKHPACKFNTRKPDPKPDFLEKTTQTPRVKRKKERGGKVDDDDGKPDSSYSCSDKKSNTSAGSKKRVRFSSPLTRGNESSKCDLKENKASSICEDEKSEINCETKSKQSCRERIGEDKPATKSARNTPKQTSIDNCCQLDIPCCLISPDIYEPQTQIKEEIVHHVEIENQIGCKWPQQQIHLSGNVNNVTNCKECSSENISTSHKNGKICDQVQHPNDISRNRTGSEPCVKIPSKQKNSTSLGNICNANPEQIEAPKSQHNECDCCTSVEVIYKTDLFNCNSTCTKGNDELNNGGCDDGVEKASMESMKTCSSSPHSIDLETLDDISQSLNTSTPKHILNETNKNIVRQKLQEYQEQCQSKHFAEMGTNTSNRDIEVQCENSCLRANCSTSTTEKKNEKNLVNELLQTSIARLRSRMSASAQKTPDVQMSLTDGGSQTLKTSVQIGTSPFSSIRNFIQGRRSKTDEQTEKTEYKNIVDQCTSTDFINFNYCALEPSYNQQIAAPITHWEDGAYYFQVQEAQQNDSSRNTPPEFQEDEYQGNVMPNNEQPQPFFGEMDERQFLIQNYAGGYYVNPEYVSEVHPIESNFENEWAQESPQTSQSAFTDSQIESEAIVEEDVKFQINIGECKCPTCRLSKDPQ